MAIHWSWSDPEDTWANNMIRNLDSLLAGKTDEDIVEDFMDVLDVDNIEDMFVPIHRPLFNIEE